MSVYIVFSHEDNIYPAQATNDLDAAKQTAQELVDTKVSSKATVEEWPLDGAWWDSQVVYEYPMAREQDQEGAEHDD